MLVIDESKIRGLGDEIKFLAKVASSDLSFSDYHSGNIFIAQLKDKNVEFTFGRRPIEQVITHIEKITALFIKDFETLDTASLIFGYTYYNNKVHVECLYDLDNRKEISPFYDFPLISRFKMNDKLFILDENNKPGFLCYDFDALPLVALFKSFSERFLFPKEEITHTTPGVRMAIEIIAKQHGVKLPATSYTQYHTVANPMSSFVFSQEQCQSFIDSFYSNAPAPKDGEEKITIIGGEEEDDEVETIVVNKPIDIDVTYYLSAFISSTNKEEFIRWMRRDEVSELKLDVDELKEKFQSCKLSSHGYIIFYAYPEKNIFGTTYNNELSELKRIVKYDYVGMGSARNNTQLSLLN